MIEIESTSDCNARCPACSRTRFPETYDSKSIPLSDFKKIFNTPEMIQGKRFQFFGVLGDPILNPDCLEISEFLIENGGHVRLSTNGGYGSKNFWDKLGQLSHDTQKLMVTFSVDGHRQTNYIYRIGTKFDIIERNMDIFTKSGKRNVQGEWIYLLFDHNLKEIKKAEEHAGILGLKFAIKLSLRNISEVTKDDLIKFIPQNLLKTIPNVTYNQSGFIDSSLADLKEEIISKTNSKSYPANINPAIFDTITCRYYDEKRLFLAHNKTLWPCCFLWDSYFSRNIRKSGMPVNVFDEYESGFNSLEKHSIQKVLDHVWFSKDLKESWFPNHKNHIKKCVRSCAKFQSFRDKLIDIKVLNQILKDIDGKINPKNRY